MIRRMSHRSNLARALLLLLMIGAGALPPLLAAPSDRQTRQEIAAQAPETASYRMEVALDPDAKTVTGTERITYRNPSDDTLDEVWLRLYLKAFSSPDTIWMQEGGGMHRGQAADPDNLGDITVHQLTLADGTDLLAGATITDTLMRVPLPQSLAPDGTLELDLRWTSKLPRVFARTGYGGRNDTFFMVGQWYPKMAVYDRGRWDTEPWHQNSEFFHDFGSYEVTITAPEQYILAGVGVPDGEAQIANGSRTQRYTATAVTDFAFAASPDFLIESVTTSDAEVVLYYLPEHEASVSEYLESATGSLRAFSDWYGPYPHPRLSIVDVPDNALGAGGMEYPTLVTGGTAGLPAGSGGVALVTAHEVGHQWWPMQTATDEAREPWLDEGLTEYSGARYLAQADRGLGFGPLRISAASYDRASYSVASGEPSNLPAWQYEGVSYGSAVYNKPAVGLWTLENVVGAERLRDAMADYLAAYRFKHPTADDFRSTLEASLDQDLDWFFDQYIGGSGVIDYQIDAMAIVNNTSQAIIRRQGEVAAPVEIELTYASGATATETWNGATETTTFTGTAADPLVVVKIDPDRKLVAELDRLDNAAATQPQTGAVLTVGGRLSFWLQTILNTFGLFG